MQPLCDNANEMSDLSSCLVSRVLTTSSGTCTQCLMVNRQSAACAWRHLNGRRRRTRRCSNVMSGVGCDESAGFIYSGTQQSQSEYQ